MSWLKKAWRWLKRNWKIVTSTGGIILAVLVGAVLVRDVRKRRKQVCKIQILKAEKEVARLQGQRGVIRQQVDVVGDEIEEVDEQIAVKTDEIKKSRAEIDRLSSKKKLDEFKNLGYGGGK